VTRRLVPFVLVVVATGCGSGTKSAADIQECVKKRLPAGAVDRIFANTEEGVTSVNYFHKGGETDMSVFASVDDAVAAERAEARLGDAHDRRLKNVLYSGGGPVEAAIVECVK
jgi:TRAP-type mannitol/chloroaromatic compound transport system substrate-binding protein